MHHNYKLGKSYIRLSYQTENKLTNYIKKLFAFHEDSAPNENDIDCFIHIADQPFIDDEMKKAQFVPSNIGLWYGEDGYIKREKHFDYMLKVGVADITIKIYPKPRKNIKQLLRAFVLCGSLDIGDLIIPTLFSYKYFWTPLAMVLLHKGCAFIHAGICANDQKAVLICGVGGSGKTSTTINLINEFKLNYFAEDFGIIDKNGNAYLSPRALSIYQSDVRNLTNKSKDLFYKSFTWLAKLSWWANINLLKRNPIKRVPVSVAFSERGNQKICKINMSVLSIGQLSQGNELAKIDLGELCQRAFHASIREMQDFYEIESQITTFFGSRNKVIKYKIIKDQMLETYNGFFAKTNNHILISGPKTVPSEKAKLIMSKLDEQRHS